MKIKTESVIELSDWDDLVKETYGRPYSFQQQDGCKDRGREKFTVPGPVDDYCVILIPEVVNHEEMGVSFKAWLARDPKQLLPDRSDTWGLELWWERNFYPSLSAVANDLHARGLLAAGSYTIDIDW
jgi:hypothetical protein